MVTLPFFQSYLRHVLNKELEFLTFPDFATDQVSIVLEDPPGWMVKDTPIIA